jgi:activator of HSP90 ATPase
MKTKNIRMSVTIKASPSEVYDALMDQKKHSRFTGAPAKISRKVGGKFSAFDGYCEGVNLELMEGNKIVQSWRASDWPEGHLSTITYSLIKTPDGTKLVFTQIGVPERERESIKNGWKEFYWTPLKKMLES